MKYIALIFLALFLSGCGGGGSSDQAGEKEIKTWDEATWGELVWE